LTSTVYVEVDEKVLNGYVTCMTPEQCRAARGWLDISQADLAARANVSLSTVRDFEKRRREPIANNLNAIKAALEGMGISFQSTGITGPLIDEIP
jgi:DNA-binding transcriptional regulator YiaG